MGQGGGGASAIYMIRYYKSHCIAGALAAACLNYVVVGSSSLARDPGNGDYPPQVAGNRGTNEMLTRAPDMEYPPQADNLSPRGMLARDPSPDYPPQKEDNRSPSGVSMS